MAVENPIRKAFQEAVEKRDTKCEAIDTGDLGVKLWCRVLRARDQSKFSSRCANKDTGEKVRQNYAAEYLSLCLCDESGKLIFEGENGVIDLQDMPAKALTTILDECHRVNGEKASVVKNSATTGEGDSSTDSPVTSAAQ